MAMGDTKPDDYKIANSQLGDMDFDKWIYPKGVEDTQAPDFQGDGNNFDSAYLPDYNDYDDILAKQDDMGEAAMTEGQPQRRNMRKGMAKKGMAKKGMAKRGLARRGLAKKGLKRDW